MSRGPQTLKQGDVTKAIKAAMNAGLSVKRFEVDREGKIIVITGDAPPSASTGNEWDDVR
jgi:deoxycytidylate deaminase